MNLDNLHVAFWLLVFLLPGYVYTGLKSKFQPGSEETRNFIIVIGLLFNSVILHLIAWKILKSLFDKDILVIFNTGFHYSHLTDYFDLILNQLGLAILIGVILATIYSANQFKRLITLAKEKTFLSKVLNFGLQDLPHLFGIFYFETDFRRKFIGCVIELKDGSYYEGNVRHVSYGEEGKDPIIVLTKVVKLTKTGLKKKLPEDISVLIPYGNINTISYKTYLIDKEVKTPKKKFSFFTPLILSKERS